MSEPKIVRKCPQCGEVYLVPLSDRALAEEYFRCAKCGYSEPVGERNRHAPAEEED